MSKTTRLVLGAVLALALVSCGGGKPDPAELLSEAADTMAAVEQVQFEITREGQPVPLDLRLAMLGEVSLLGAKGAYRAADGVYATATISPGPTVAEILWLADGTFAKLGPLAFMPIDLGDFDATRIFDEQNGLPGILRGLADPALVGEEDVDGVATYHISAQSEGEALSSLVAGAVTPGPVTIDVWVSKSTTEVVQILLTEQSGDKWLIEFFGFGEAVEFPSP